MSKSDYPAGAAEDDRAPFNETNEEESKQYVFYCEDCESENVQIKMWVNPNTEALHGECSTDVLEDGWCKKCGEHALIKSRLE